MASSSFDEPDLPGTGRGARADPYPRYRRPSGGLVADVADVVRFGRWQLSEPWTDALRRPLAKPVSGVYGLGFFGERVAGVEVWGHPGSAYGYQASFLLVPDRGAVFAGLTNSGSGARALAELEDLWLQRLLGAGRRRAEPVELPSAVLASFAGSYANAATTVTVSVEGNGLLAEVVDGTGGGHLDRTADRPAALRGRRRRLRPRPVRLPPRRVRPVRQRAPAAGSVIAAVAAGHRATAEAGVELLRAGGSAADAAVGACLASCVAETIMTGLLGGGHAIYLDAATGVAANLDCFVAVPTGDGAPMEELEVHVRRGGRPLRDRRVVVRSARCSRRARRPLARARQAAVGRRSSGRLSASPATAPSSRPRTPRACACSHP